MVQNTKLLTQIIHGNIVFEMLADEWDTLAGQSMTDTPFQTLAYQKGWWQHLQPENAELYSVVVRDAAGVLTAVACFYLTSDSVVHFNGCVEETDYLDLLVREADAEAAWTAVIAQLKQPEFPAWQSLDLCNIPEASLSRSILAGLASGQGLTCQESIHEVCPIITLPDSFDAYLNTINSKQRREVRRKLRRAAGAEAVLNIVTPENDLQAEVDAFLTLLQKSTFEKRDWLNDGRRALFYDTAQAAQKAGTLQLMFMEVEGQKAAALFNFDYKDRIWVYNSGLDPQAFGALSLGVVLTAKAIEVAIGNGRSTFDFLRGNETYKYHFGAKDTRVYRLQLGRA